METLCNRTSNSTPPYYYTGYCPYSGKLLKLPRTQEVEQIARILMLEMAREEDIYAREGKMFGVLLVEKNTGEYYSIKAFSGLLNGEAVIDGWVPPIPGRDRVAIEEADTLKDLARMKQELIDLDRFSTGEASAQADAFLRNASRTRTRTPTTARERYKLLAAEFADKLEKLAIEHRQRKAFRQQQRERFAATLHDIELITALDRLAAESRQDGRERRQLKQERDAVLQPLQDVLDQTDDRIRELKQQRKIRSRQLQIQMHDAYRLMNFLGTSSSLRELMPAGIPTGTGDCCAPKLLHYAASQGLKPMAMAEFWWGDGVDEWMSGWVDGEMRGRGDGGTGRKIQGEFYGACAERCQPLMGFMLAGLSSQMSHARSGLQNTSISPSPYLRLPSPNSGRGFGGEGDKISMAQAVWMTPTLPNLSLPIIYEDEYLIAIDKPAGLLSVPGRTIELQDSVLTRLRALYPEIYTVHRLDRDTSGTLLLARDKVTYRHLSQQFEARQVRKIYEAILGGQIELDKGSIDLPLWGDPLDRPRQKVDFKLGKPSLTKFQVLGQIDGYTRVEFFPVTGRTHQLRVHAADARGLSVCILGDRLYGCQANVKRLYLHARELSFTHPSTLERISVQTPCTF
ncbi:23S RNA-specific pseudouridylate synthase [Chamaesiphon minutus PCC 6605]|uniref:RNA pseudouridylate synthase n=2 Tax=Chamaesiphon TaxID=217161 RepID=K9UJD4_CHAP6|nr:23S RNA-specific pseudouridylate synthase [Chamaesiphon minutus PCC 6605]